MDHAKACFSLPRDRAKMIEELECLVNSEQGAKNVQTLGHDFHHHGLEQHERSWVPPPALQHWLQLTYELELKAYNHRKQFVEKELKQAKDACDKLKKKRSSLIGAFVSTHGRATDGVDKAIMKARSALKEVTLEFQERIHRWRQIELLMNCPIISNPGLPYLEILLRGFGRSPSCLGPGSVASDSQDDMEDDRASSIIYCPSIASGSAVHAPIARSKSVSCLVGAREGTHASRYWSSKDSSMEDAGIVADAAELNAVRRIKCGSRADSDVLPLRKCASVSFQHCPPKKHLGVATCSYDH